MTPDEPDTALEQDPPPPPPAKRFPLVTLLLLLVALGGGAAALLLAPYRDVLDRVLGTPPVASGAPPPGIDLAAPPTFVTIEPFTANLREDEGRRYVQVVFALRLNAPEAAAAVPLVMPELRHRINLLLAGKLPSQLATPTDREALAVEIAREANLALNYPAELDPQGQLVSTGPVSAVRFASFLIQ